MILILAPGETYAPGRPANWTFGGEPAGKTGTPGTETAGQSFPVTAYATDNFFNQVSTNALVSLTSDDAFGAPNNVTPLTQALNAGTTVFNVTLLSAQDAGANVIKQSSVIKRGHWPVTRRWPSPCRLNTLTRLQVLLDGKRHDAGAGGCGAS